MRLGKKLRTLGGGRVAFWCAGCGEMHQISVKDGERPGWGFNGDGDAPTFTPSVLVKRTTAEPPVTPENLDEWKRHPWPQTDRTSICHSFVTDGRIQYLGDCTHALVGQTVNLPDLPESAT